MLGALKKGDEVITSGGLMGKVKGIKDERGDHRERHQHRRGPPRPHRPGRRHRGPQHAALMPLLPIHLLGSPVLREPSRADAAR